MVEKILYGMAGLLLAGTCASAQAPLVANRSVRIVVEVRSPKPDGVVLAHGGKAMGYVLHFEKGVPVFEVRKGDVLHRIEGGKALAGRIKVDALLDEDFLQLFLDGKPLVKKVSPGFLSSEPKDGVSVGHDSGSMVGNYSAPAQFKGIVVSTRIDAGGEPPKPEPAMSAEEIRTGLDAHERALYILEGWIRDPYIILGPDDFYYLTGTTPNPGDSREASDPYNSGLGSHSIVGEEARVWRSPDLVEWEELPAPFKLTDGIWYAEKPKVFEESDKNDWKLWAPELHWLGDRWALTHTSPSPVDAANLAAGKTEVMGRPWSNPMGMAIGKRHDPSLFNDGGTWYMLWGNTELAPLKSDFSGFTAEPVRIDPAGSRPGANGKPISVIGHEGATMQKIGEKYVHFGTAWSTDMGRRGSYNLYYCTADNITGPYGPRKFAGRFLGHGTPFTDRQGRWWCTAFYNGNVPPLSREDIETRDLGRTAQTINRRGTTIVPLEVKILDDGDIYIRAKDPAYGTIGPDEAQTF